MSLSAFLRQLDEVAVATAFQEMTFLTITLLLLFACIVIAILRP